MIITQFKQFESLRLRSTVPSIKMTTEALTAYEVLQSIVKNLGFRGLKLEEEGDNYWKFNLQYDDFSSLGSWTIIKPSGKIKLPIFRNSRFSQRTLDKPFTKDDVKWFTNLMLIDHQRVSQSIWDKFWEFDTFEEAKEWLNEINIKIKNVVN